ncbi:amidase [Tabrizicola sp. M-4]|uniref:amidase n=1 Tax=Tabrizicola sp. M-4 TaxID=3055847 RepID=UPI003DA963D4
MNIVEASLADLRAALDDGRTTSVALTAAYLNRIAADDRHGARLNAVPVLNPAMFEEARASDLRRTRGETLGPLDGIPYTAKNSYKAKGLTVASGSPAFADLVASDDAFAIARLRAAGAVLIGLTNMPPMANGGMQRGVYGRAESPYNADYLTAAYASGSSNGSGTATAASFAAFGLGEETWSSGRAPAANNGLCAYTPSRGVISVRGNWPLVPTMDVVVPHTRSMADMLQLLDILVADDPETRGDLWRSQPWIAIPKASEIRPHSYPALAETASLAGKRIGVPAMYINADPLAGTADDPGIGGPTGQRIVTRPSILSLWHRARQAMEAAGATVIVTDFPVITNYEGDRPGAPTLRTRGLVPPAYLKREIMDLSVWSWDDFLAANDDPTLNRLSHVDGSTIFPLPKGALRDRYDGFDDDIATYPAFAAAHPVTDFRTIPHLAEGFAALEETRHRDLEEWMDALRLDAVVFPAVADVAPADADRNPDSFEKAWANGVWVANGNLAIRHLGIPTVTVPMGVMEDTGMPAGLTFAGRGWEDNALLQIACAFEATGHYRQPPSRVPDETLAGSFPLPKDQRPAPGLSVTVEDLADGRQQVTVHLQSHAALTRLRVNGQTMQGTSLTLPKNTHIHSEWQAPYGPIVVAEFEDGTAAFAAL